MSYRVVFLVGLLLLALMSTTFAEGRTQTRMIRLEDQPVVDLNPGVTLSAADTCVVRHDQGLYYRIEGWLVGNELYKSLIDPAESCPDAYPFTITAVNMTLAFDGGTPLTVSVDVEEVDSISHPGCKIPGEILTISSDAELVVPAGGGVYDIWVPLDSPVVVTGPVFVGFFISNVIDTAAGAALVTDSVPVSCVSYNIWDTNVGWVDLASNVYWSFPGRPLLYAAGIPGGGPVTDPPPLTQFIFPDDGSTLYGQSELWVRDTSGSTIIDYVSFSYASAMGGGSFVNIETDHDGTSPLRNGVDEAESGNGFSVPWDFAGVTEGIYTVRATIYDTEGRSSVSEIAVLLDPTPPLPRIIEPDEGTAFCSPVRLDLTCSDENIASIRIDSKPANANYGAGMTALDQNTVGDTNGDAGDGNTIIGGEYGEYYSGPVAAAVAIRLWYDRGYTPAMLDGDSTLSMTELAEVLADEFDTRQNLGTHDEDFFLGLRRYCYLHGNDLAVSYQRLPGYYCLRKAVEQDEQAVLIGVGGNPGIWLAVNGFNGWQMFDSTWHLRISSPASGSIVDMPVRETQSSGRIEILYAATWHPVDLMITLSAEDWPVADMSLAGVDSDGNDGWAVEWTPMDMTAGEHVFLKASTEDATNCEGSTSTLLKYDCSQAYKPGDLDNNGESDLADLYRLIYFISMAGPAPEGGAARADCNCDNVINVADIVYYMNYLYGYTGPPCY